MDVEVEMPDTQRTVKLNVEGQIFEVSLDKLCHPKLGRTFFTQMFRNLLDKTDDSMQPSTVDESGAFILHERSAAGFDVLWKFISSGELPSSLHERAVIARGLFYPFPACCCGNDRGCN